VKSGAAHAEGRRGMSGRGRQSFGRVSQRSQGTEVKVSPSARSTKERTRPGGAAHQATQPPPISQGGFKDLVVGNPWRSELAEWASRAGITDSFRSECWNPAAASPAAGGWRSQLGGLSLAELIGGATWRSDLAEWVGGVGWRSGRVERDSSTVSDPSAGRLGSGFAGRWRLAVSAWRT